MDSNHHHETISTQSQLHTGPRAPATAVAASEKNEALSSLLEMSSYGQGSNLGHQPDEATQTAASYRSPPPTPPTLDTTIVFEADFPFLDSKAKGDGHGDDTGDPFDEVSDNDDEENRSYSTYMGRVVLNCQRWVSEVVEVIDERCGGYFFKGILLLLYLSYFIYAMYYRFGDEGSVRLLWCTLIGVVIASRHVVWNLAAKTPVVRWGTGPKPPSTARRVQTARFFLRWLMYGAVGAFMGYVIVDVAIKDPVKLRSLPGIFAFLLISFLFSTHPSKVNWHTIYWSLAVQFILAVLVMRWRGGKIVIMWIHERLDSFFDNGKPTSKLLFGETYTDHYLIFGAFPIIFLTNAALSMLYHLGAMQFIVKVIGSSLRFILGTTAIESTGVAASIFMEGVTALLAIRPYLNKLTKSELFALTSACLSSIGGAFLALLSQVGISVEFMLPAMVISAPATFAVCKLVVPETRKPRKIAFGGDLPPDMQYSSLLEAAQAGAISVVSVVVNVVVSVFSLFSLISWVNSMITWFGMRVGIEQLTLETILSYVFYPFALLMGIELRDCRNVAMLMGYRFTTSSFVAMLKMLDLVSNRNKFQEYSLIPNATVSYLGDHIVLDQWNMTLVDGYISRRSEAISTYSLCGFSGIMSLFVTIGILGTLLPKRQHYLISMGLPLLITGNLANFMVGCFAGLLADI